jgi:hypothetical protein
MLGYSEAFDYFNVLLHLALTNLAKHPTLNKQISPPNLFYRQTNRFLLPYASGMIYVCRGLSISKKHLLAHKTAESFSIDTCIASNTLPRLDRAA